MRYCVRNELTPEQAVLRVGSPPSFDSREQPEWAEHFRLDLAFQADSEIKQFPLDDTKTVCWWVFDEGTVNPHLYGLAWRNDGTVNYFHAEALPPE
jgi:hypothetical protein